MLATAFFELFFVVDGGNLAVTDDVNTHNVRFLGLKINNTIYSVKLQGWCKGGEKGVD